LKVLSISLGGLQQCNGVEKLHKNGSKMETWERKTDRAWVSRQYSKEDVGKGNTVLVVPNVQKTKQKSVQERDLPPSSVKILNL
jgi:hypothetical protein